MELDKFTEKIVSALSGYYGTEVEIKTHKVYKNNGILMQGVCVLEKGKNIAPTVYLNSFLNRYEKGECFGALVKEIVDFTEKNQINKDLEMDFFRNYDEVKSKLVLRLIHLEKNQELLNKVPFIKYHDLAIVCHCVVITEEIGVGAILIQKEHLNTWKIEEEILFQDAFKNSPKIEPYQILKMSDVVKKILQESIREKVDEICGEYSCDREILFQNTLKNMESEIEEKHIPMYVLTNEKRYYGAACMVYPDVLDTIAHELQDDFYILPSSIHEIIVVAKTECADSFSLNEMIEEVNRTQVEEDEWLSDHTYLYQRKNQKLISVTNQ